MREEKPVETGFQNKIKSYVGFAVKSGKVAWGLEYIKKSKTLPYLVLIDAGTGADTRKKTKQFTENTDIPVLEVKSLSGLCGRNGVKVLGIREANLAEAIISAAKVTEVAE